MLYLIIGLSLIGMSLMVWRRTWMPYILMLSLPLEIFPTSEIFGATVRVSNLLFLAAFLILFFEWLVEKKRLFKKYDLLLGLFLAVGVISLNDALDLKRGLVLLFATFYVFVVFTVIRNLFENMNKEAKFKFIGFLLWVMFGTALFGLYQFLGGVMGLPAEWTLTRPIYAVSIFGFPRIHSTLFEPLFYGNFLIVPLLMIVGSIVADVKIVRNWVLYMMGAVFLMVFVLTLSRGAYVSLLISLLAMCWFLRRSFDFKKMVSLVFMGILGLGLSFSLIAFSGWYYPKYVAERQTGSVVEEEEGPGSAVDKFVGHSTTTTDFSSADRAWRTKVALETWRKKPVLGVGVGNYGPMTAEKYGSAADMTVMNLYAETLAETGVLGLILLLVFLGYIAWLAYVGVSQEKDGTIKLIIIVFLCWYLGTLVQYVSFSPVYIAQIWFYIGLLAAAGMKRKNV